MGTRSLTAVTFGDQLQIARVGLFDGSPDKAGADILNVLKEENGLTLTDWLYRCEEIDDAEYNKFFHNGVLNKTALVEAHPNFFFGSAAELFRTLLHSDRDPTIHNDYNFVYDSLQCEWAYVIDFKKWTFEVYKGFNKTPLTPQDRFYNNGYHKGEYYPVRLIKLFDLNHLPTVSGFIMQISLANFNIERSAMEQQIKVGIYCLCRTKPNHDTELFRKHAVSEALRLFNEKDLNHIIYMDEVILGQKSERKELERLIEDAIAGKIDSVFIADAGDLWHSPQKVWETISSLSNLEKKVKLRCYMEVKQYHWKDTFNKLFDEAVIQNVFKVIQRDAELQFLRENFETISPYTKGVIVARNISQDQFATVVMHHACDLSDDEYESFIKSFGMNVQDINDVIDCWHAKSEQFDKAVEVMAERIISYYLV